MFHQKKSQYKYNAILSTVIVAAILIVLGLLSSKLFVRFDLTSNKQFSISKATIETLENLDDIAHIKAYFSEKLPAEFLSVKQDARDILDEYKTYSKGNLKIEFIDPKDDENLRKEAKNYGIPELQFSDIQKDKYEVSKGYLGLAVLYSANKEVIPAIKDAGNLEYELTSAIKKTSRAEPIKVGFLTGHSEISQEELSALYEELGRVYEVSTIDISDGSLISDNIKTLVIAGPSEKFSARDKYAIDQFVMNGGSLLLLYDGVDIDIESGLGASKNKTDISELIEHYGIKAGNDLVLDPVCGIGQFSSGFFSFRTPYVFWPSVSEDGFNQENPITSDLGNVVFSWAGSLEVLEEKLAGGAAVKLAVSSGKSWLMKDSFNVNPDQSYAPEGDFGNKALAIFAKGSFESYFKGKAVPEKEIEKENAGEEIFPEEGQKDSVKKDQTDNGKIIVISDSDFIKDRFAARANNDNLAFFQNALDSITIDEALMAIRSKTSSSRPLKSGISEGAKSAMKFLNIFLVSVLLAAIGIIRWIARRRAKEVF